MASRRAPRLALLVLTAAGADAGSLSPTRTPSPDHSPFPPTYVVPGASVMGAFYNLAELVSSTYPFTAGGGGGHATGARRMQHEEAPSPAARADHGGTSPGDATEDAAAALAASHDAGLSLFSRGRAAARLASRLLAEGMRGWPSGAAAAPPASRRLVGGAPVIDAGLAPAALFCDVEPGSNLTQQRVLYGDAIYASRAAAGRRRRLQSAPGDAAALWDAQLPSALAAHASAHDAARLASARGGGGGRALHAAANATTPPFGYPLPWPYLRYAVEEWCTLARFQPQVLAAFGFGTPKTLLVPDFYGFLSFSARFPAWWEWLSAFPTCISTFNRMAFFLQLHASWRRVSCATPRAANCSYADFPSATLPRVGSTAYYAGHDVDNRPFVTAEKLRIGRVLGSPGIRDWSTCRVDTRRHFSFDSARPDGPSVSPNVRAQFLGRDGNILLLDGVMVPLNVPLMRYPSISLLDFVLGHPQLNNFSRLLVQTGLAPFLALAPLFSDHFLAFVNDSSTGGSDNSTGAPGHPRGDLACLCANAIGAPVPASVCRAILRFLYNLFHSVTLFAPLDAAFAKLPPGVADYLFDPTNTELARYVLLTHFLHGQTYLYDCSLGDAIRQWRRLDQRTASNSILTLSSLYDSVTPQSGSSWHGGRRAQATAAPAPADVVASESDFDADADAVRGVPYGGRPAGATPASAPADPATVVAGSSFVADDDAGAQPCDGAANIVRGGRTIQLLLHFNNAFNPSPYSARSVATNIETTTGIVHKIDGLLIDGCASAFITGGLFGSFGSSGSGFSVLDCQCAHGNPFPLACSPASWACPADGGNASTAPDDAWPWRQGAGSGFAHRRCSCPVRPWDAVYVDAEGSATQDPGRLRYVPWHTLNAELLGEALALDTQWQITQLHTEFRSFRRLLVAATEGSAELASVRAAEARFGVAPIDGEAA